MKHRFETGFTLIEVLVSMIILSIGLLALVGMQLAAMQNTQGGSLRAQASMMAYDVMDRMRANNPSVTNGDYDLALAEATPAQPVCAGVAANCSTTQIADFDLAQWRTIMGIYMPAGNGSVATVDNGTTTGVTVTINWIDPYSAEDGTEVLAMVAEFPR
jgi:type IV pilus assembly protein PilV